MDVKELWIEEFEVLVNGEEEVCEPLELVDVAADLDYV